MTSHCLEIWGDFACFSRPEAKVERYSYPVITPSAARGVFDAIYVKPGSFRWQIERIEVLAPPSFIALRRNEVKDVANARAVQRWMAGKSEPEPIWADGDKAALGTDTKGRTQRQTMALRKPRYRVYAHVVPWPGHEARRPAFDAQFVRRASGGKCVFQPYLGCREFPAYFELVSEVRTSTPTDLDLDVGFMLYDVFDLSRPGTCDDKPSVSLFRAQIRGGVLDVPAFESAEVLRPAGGA